VTSALPNPYPGPRSFQRGEALHGRTRETSELLDLLIAERIVLFYSPSGAGKTSLVQAALIPALEREGFRVLPPLRVGLPLGEAMPDANRYLLSLLQTLEELRPAQEQRPPSELAGLSLAAYLEQDGASADQRWHGDVLIFDQFEEVLTVDPSDRAGKLAFFAQIGQALRDRNRWALFVMREEFIAALDPYLRPIPTRFDKGRRYRLDLLGPAAARLAMQQPAAAAGVEFSDAAAARLADDLRTLRVQQPDGSTLAALGNVIEPVQLQVVCRRLWERLQPDDRLIDVADIAAVGDVDTALRGYYADAVAAVADQTGLAERAIREWCDKQLITDQGIRGQVLQGPERSQGLDNRAIWPLVDAHLLRAEQRRGATWFELAHDRLIEPVAADNAAWREAHLTPFQRQAALWEQAGRPEGLLLSGGALAEAARWAAAAQPAGAVEPHERAFLAAAQAAAAQAAYRARQARRIRRLAVVLAVIAVIALAASLLAWRSSRQARARELAAAAVANLAFDPQRSLLLALASLDTDPSVMAEDALHRALEASRVEAVLAGHDGEVSDVAYSPDGSRLASAGFDGALRLWDARDHALLQSWPTGHGQVYSVAWSPDGLVLASTGQDGAVRLWDAATGEELIRLEAHSDMGNSVAWSADGALFASGGDDGQVLVWDAVTLDQVQAVSLPNQPWVKAVAFSPDGDRLAAALAFPQGLQTPSHTVAVDGGPGANNERGTLRQLKPSSAVVLDPLTGDELLQLTGHGDSVLDVAWSPQCVGPPGGGNERCDELIATASADGTARTWDGQTGELRDVLAGHAGWVQGVAFSSDGQRLATSSWDRTAKVWEASSGRELFTLARHGGWLRGLDWNPACLPALDPADAPRCGQQLATASEDGTVRLWNTGPSREALSFVASSQPVLRLAWSPDGQRLATAGRDGQARVWDAATGRGEWAVQHLGPVRDVAWSPDGSRLATASDDRSAVIWDAATAEKLATLSGTGGVVTGVAWSPDGQRVATSGSDGLARLWDAASGEELLSLAGHGSRVNNVAWSHDGRRLVTSGGDRTARVWDAQSGALLQTLIGHTQEVYYAAWSADDALIATAGVDQAVKLWNAASGTELRTLQGHGNRVQAVAFSPLGQIASASWDRTARLWEPSSGALLATLMGAEGELFHAAFSPAGERLATAGRDGVVRLYLTQAAALRRLAAEKLVRSWSEEECQLWFRPSACPAASQ
jgi:WD40 repeat protein